MARPRKEDRIALLAAARALMGERLMCPLPAVDDGGLLIGATGLELAHRAQVGWDQAQKTIENMLAAGELARLGKHRPEWSDRTVWVYAAVTPPPRWAEHHKESLDALAALSTGWVAETAAAPADEPAEPVAGRVPHEQRELVP